MLPGTLARSDVLWEVAEPEAPGEDGVHHYDWSFADGVAGALARHGIQWLALVDYATPWSASVPGNTHSPPRDAIKAADPQARVIIGGLSNAPGFIPQLFAARPDVSGQLDGVAGHPYARTALGVLDVVR